MWNVNLKKMEYTDKIKHKKYSTLHSITSQVITSNIDKYIKKRMSEKFIHGKINER